MKKPHLLAAVCIWVGMIQPATAALVGINDPAMAFLGVAQDDLNITRDTETKLEWLDWSLTLDRTYNDVFSETQGGSLDGWRYATEDEFISLALAAGIPVEFLDAVPGGTDPSFDTLSALLGSTSLAGESIAISAVSISLNFHALGGFTFVQDCYEVPNNNVGVCLNQLWPDDEKNPRIGSALVRPIPLPPSVWLFGSGLLGLLGIAPRKAP